MSLKNFGLKHYYRPTPEKIRKTADAWVITCLFITGSSIINQFPKVALTFIILGALGKFFSNFFSINEDQSNEKVTQK